MTEPVYTDFTGRDFTARFEALVARLMVELPELTDLNHSDAGISLLRLLAREIDQVQFYLDQAFAESFVPSARFKQSLIDLAALTDYPIKLASAATGSVLLTRIDGITGAISVPTGTEFRRADGVTYASSEPLVMAADENTLVVPVRQGTFETITVRPQDFTVVDRSGRPKYNLGTNVAYGSVSVHETVLNVDWAWVDSLWRSQAADRHFVVELYADKWNGVTDTAFLVLGDGTRGRTTPVNDLEVTYFKTSGAGGNTGANTVTRFDMPLFGQVTCTNHAIISGGAAAEAINTFRDRLPEITRTQRRAVSLTDYEALIEAVPGVARCRALDRNYGLEWPHMYVALFVVPEGGGDMSSELRTAILEECSEHGALGSWAGRYILRCANESQVPISCQISVKEGYQEATVVEAVRLALVALFDPSVLDIGQALTFSALNMAVERVPGVNWVDFYTPQASVVPGVDEFLTPGSIAIAVTS